MVERRPRVLLIEDDTGVRDTVHDMLRELRCDVVVAGDAAQGLTAARAVRPDVVVLDLNLPGQSGLDFLPELRERFPRVPVIAITAVNHPETEGDVRGRGAFAYLPKPVQLHALDEFIEAAMRQAGGRGGD